MSDLTMGAVASILGLPAAPSAVSEPIDHVAESERIADAASRQNPAQYGAEGYDLGHVVAALDAQRHATLALVEHQRIANLIAYQDSFPVSPKTAEAIRAEVERGVGLL